MSRPCECMFYVCTLVYHLKISPNTSWEMQLCILQWTNRERSIGVPGSQTVPWMTHSSPASGLDLISNLLGWLWWQLITASDKWNTNRVNDANTAATLKPRPTRISSLLINQRVEGKPLFPGKWRDMLQAIFSHRLTARNQTLSVPAAKVTLKYQLHTADYMSVLGSCSMCFMVLCRHSLQIQGLRKSDEDVWVETVDLLCCYPSYFIYGRTASKWLKCE